MGTIWDTDIYKQDKFPEIISKINCTDGVGSNIDDILGFGKFIAKKFADGYQFFKHYSMMGQGDVSFWWLFFSVKEKKIAVIDGIMYWGSGSILLGQPKFINLSVVDKSSTLSISDISHKIVSEFGFFISKEDAKEIYSLLKSNN